MNSNKHNPVVCFRRWSRKNYAVFASLNKVVKIGVVTFGCTLVQQQYQPIMAQSDSARIGQKVTLNEVEVAESRLKLGSELGRTISVVDRKEIAASPAHSIDDILEQVAGVDVRQRGSDGVQADLSIRGGSFDQAMILLNGVNITDPQTGHYSLDIPVTLQQIQRIEILQGSGARIWGPNAFSGAINVITTSESTLPKKQGQLEFGGGSFGYLNQSASGTLQQGPWQFGAGLSHKQSDGYTKNTDFDQLNSHFQTSFQNRTVGKLLLQLGFQQKSFGANSFYSFSYPNQFERTKTLFSSLNWKKRMGKTDWQATVYERQHHDRFELFRNMNQAASWYTGHNYHQTDATGGSLTTNSFTRFGKTTAGIDLRNEHIYSNVLGKNILKSKKDFLDENAVFTKAKNRTNYRVLLDQTFFFGPFYLSIGGSGNYNSDFGRYYFGGLDLGVDINPSFKAFFNVNQAVRLPTFTDLYYKSATQISNPNLKKEFSMTYEAGFKYNRSNFKASASAYFRDGKNVIDWVKMPDSTKWESKNLTQVKAFGGNIQAEYLFNQGFLQTIRWSYSYLQLDKQANGYDSKYALDYLHQKVNVQLEHRIFERSGFGTINGVWNASWQDRAGNYTNFKTNLLTNYQPYFIADLRLQWNKKNIGIYTDVNNLFNQEYADFGGLSQAGRSFRAGLKLNF